MLSAGCGSLEYLNLRADKSKRKEKKVDENKKQELTEEQREELKNKLNDQFQKLGEVFSQCWESDEFKEAFMDDPKAVFEEYGVDYDHDKEYKIIETPEKTMIHVLPYEAIKPAIEQLNGILLKNVKDLSDEDSKQILLEGWKWEIYQCTEDTIYVPIPLCPDNLTPEELEMVNGGCLLFAAFFVFVSEAVGAVTSLAVAVEGVFAVSVLTVAAAAVLVVAAAALNTALAYTNVATTGDVVIQFSTELGYVSSNNSSSGTGSGSTPGKA